ncbi:hypothetical protein Vretifemale_8535, partial [Volvox reticuliferus]
LVWEQLRWCSKWQQMRQVYDNLLRAEAAALTEAQAGQAMQATKVAAAGDDLDRSSSTMGSNTDVSNSSCSGDSSASISIDRLTTSGTSATSRNCAPGLLSRDETYAFLLQLQDFYHLQLDQKELEELQ